MVEDGYPPGGSAGRVGLGEEAPVSPGTIWQVLPQFPLRHRASGGARSTPRPAEKMKQSDGGPPCSFRGADVALERCSAAQENESPYRFGSLVCIQPGHLTLLPTAPVRPSPLPSSQYTVDLNHCVNTIACTSNTGT